MKDGILFLQRKIYDTGEVPIMHSMHIHIVKQKSKNSFYHKALSLYNDIWCEKGNKSHSSEIHFC